MNRIKQNELEEIEKIYIENDSVVKQLVIKFESGNKELSQLNDTRYSYHLSDKAIHILEYIINHSQSELIDCAKGYYKSGRDYYIFLYDLVTLCWLLEKLPAEFQLLKTIQSDGNELLHNRLVSQLAYELKKKNSIPEYEKNFQGSNPDLFTCSTHIEVKTILSSMIPDSDEIIDKQDPLGVMYQKFFDSFKRQFEKARRQIHNDGMIIVGFRSKRINNELKEYFHDRISNSLPDITKDTTVIVMEGNSPLEEHYVCLPTNQTLDLLENYCNHGRKLVDPMAYMETMMRNGFPKQTSNRDGFIMFRMD